MALRSSKQKTPHNNMQGLVLIFDSGNYATSILRVSLASSSFLGSEILSIPSL